MSWLCDGQLPVFVGMKRCQTIRRWLAAEALHARRVSPLALALVVSVLASAPRRVQASCGDYVMVRGVMVGGPHHHHLPGTPLSAPGNSGGIPSCSGPHCQRHVPLPLPPEQIVPAGTQDFACPSATSHRDPSGPGASLAEPALLVSQATLLPPEHPPRLLV